MYQVEFTAKAAKQIKKIGTSQEKLLVSVIDALAENPRPVGAKKLNGRENEYRIRVGDYRIIYTIQDNVLLVTVIKLGHHRDVYR